jgi:hypothetical protein
MVFDPKSRYAKIEIYQVKDHRGRTVTVVPVPEKVNEVPLGVHRLLQGQRIDHLAFKYLDDPAGFWRICELNDVMLPETLSEASEVKIPKKKS